MGKTQHQFAFTLAEVLITLSIIGVVAALTIPSLIVNNQEKERVVQLKKAYNVFSNAFSLAQIEYGDVTTWNITGGTREQMNLVYMDMFAPFLNMIRRCDFAKGCYPANLMYKYLDNTDWGVLDNDGNDSVRGILADGMSFYILIIDGNCKNSQGTGELETTCGLINVDVNGFKSPNVAGRDSFGFYITPKGLIPFGIDGNTSAPLQSECRGGNGHGCAAWVLLKENMDYPPAGVGWDGETTSP